jgi:acetate kinase
VGENQYGVRSGVCEGLEWMGVKFDKAKNDSVRSEECVISTPDSKVTVCLIPTDEEWMLASDTMAIVSGEK